MVLERAGHRVRLVDSEEAMGGSRVAGGHVSLRWFKGKRHQEVKQALEDAESFGLVFDRRGAIEHGKPRADWWTFEPAQFLGLRRPDAIGAVTRIVDRGIEIGGELEEAEQVVVAAGAWTDVLLRASGLELTGVRPLLGSAVLCEGAWEEKTVVHRLNPFRQYAIRDWGERTRLGETVDTRASDQTRNVEAMIGRVYPYLRREQRPLEVLTGARAMCEAPVVKRVAPRVVVATGGGKVGGSLAFWAARKVLETIG